jgi:hypothetical protein
MPNNNTLATPDACACFRFRDQFVEGKLEDAGHRGDRHARRDFLADEKRQNEVVGLQRVSRTSERSAAEREDGGDDGADS